jgi:signal transduction histidine kinase
MQRDNVLLDELRELSREDVRKMAAKIDDMLGLAQDDARRELPGTPGEKLRRELAAYNASKAVENVVAKDMLDYFSSLPPHVIRAMCYTLGFACDDAIAESEKP